MEFFVLFYYLYSSIKNYLNNKKKMIKQQLNRDFYSELDTMVFKDITFSLFNKIDDEYIPQQWGKTDNTVYGIDDFVYCDVMLDKKEKFLITMHNKEIMNAINKLKTKIKNEKYHVMLDFDNGSLIIIKLK